MVCQLYFDIRPQLRKRPPILSRLEDRAINKRFIDFHAFQIDNWLFRILLKSVRSQLCYNCGGRFDEAELSRIFRRLFSILRVNTRTRV